MNQIEQLAGEQRQLAALKPFAGAHAATPTWPIRCRKRAQALRLA